MSTKFLKCIEKLRKRPSVIYYRRDTDEMYITPGFIFNEVFAGHKFISSSAYTESDFSKNKLRGMNIPDDLEIHVIVKENVVSFTTETCDLVNVE
jgi:hypothetical protein